MYLLALAMLLELPSTDPVVFAVYRTLEECSVAAVKKAKSKEDEMHDPANVSRGMRYVCLRVMEPTI